MNEIKTIEKEFNSVLIPGINIVVENNTVKLYTSNIILEETDYTQKQICELISLLVEAYEYIDNTKENNTMELFNESEDPDNIEEIIIEDSTEEAPITEEPCNCFEEITDNVIAFLYMKEDYSLQKITKDDMHHALHILRDSISLYLDTTTQDEPEEKQVIAGE